MKAAGGGANCGPGVLASPIPSPGREASEQMGRNGLGFLKGVVGGANEWAGLVETNLSARLLPGVLVLLGGHVEAKVKLPAPLGVAGQGRHHPPAGGARRLEQPYCRHTSGQLLGEVTKRRSIHLSSGLTETRQVTLGGCLGLGPASGSVPSLLGALAAPCPHSSPQSRGVETWAEAQEAWVQV